MIRNKAPAQTILHPLIEVKVGSCSNGQQAKSPSDKIVKHPIRKEMHPDIKQVSYMRLNN